MILSFCSVCGHKHIKDLIAGQIPEVISTEVIGQAKLPAVQPAGGPSRNIFILSVVLRGVKITGSPTVTTFPSVVFKTFYIESAFIETFFTAESCGLHL